MARSRTEAARLTPRVIRTVAARPGDTAESLSALMADPNPLGLFLLLNGRGADRPIRPGELVKVVADAGMR